MKKSRSVSVRYPLGVVVWANVQKEICNQVSYQVRHQVTFRIRFRVGRLIPLQAVSNSLLSLKGGHFMPGYPVSSQAES